MLSSALPLVTYGQQPSDQTPVNQERNEGQQQQNASEQSASQSASNRQNQDESPAAEEQNVARAEQEPARPYAQPDDTWITLSGTVASVAADAFTMDYGEGVITVEMDDRDRDAEAYELAEGDKVTVRGVIDDDVFEVASIEASSVYVEKLGTTFHASPLDEEPQAMIAAVTVPVVVSGTVLQGVVTDVENDEFTLSSGAASISVEIEEMAYDPLDEEGYQQIEVGDHVAMTGYIDRDFFEGREFEARSIVTLVEEIG